MSTYQVMTKQMPGISGRIKKVRSAFELHYEASIKKPSGTGELFSCKVSDLVTGRWPVTLSIFKTDKVVMQGVPGKLPEADFSKTSNCLEHLLRECGLDHDPDSLRLVRAKSIVGFLKTQRGEDEAERIAMVLLSETVMELLLNERLSWNRILDGNLKRGGVPQKLSALRDRFGKVYKHNDMESLYEMRCGVAHEGKGVNATEATWAKNLALDLIDKVD
jgi:hypothetical protein